MAGNKELKLGIPKGSLEGMTIELFKKIIGAGPLPGR